MVVRFKKKVVKKRGSRTYGYGSPKKHRGKGSKGGKGKAGIGKKAGHKAIKLRELGYGLGKQGFKLPKEAKNIYYVLTLSEVVYSLNQMLTEGLAKQTKQGYEINIVKLKNTPVKLIKSLNADTQKFFENNKGIIKVSKVTKGVKDYLDAVGWKLEAVQESS